MNSNSFVEFEAFLSRTINIKKNIVINEMSRFESTHGTLCPDAVNETVGRSD